MSYKTTFEFSVENIPDLENKLRTYFEYYDFKFSEEGESGKYYFYKKGTILDGWKFNPLNWESDINVEITEAKKTVIHYEVKGNGQISAAAFHFMFEDFLKNFEQYVIEGADFKQRNAQQVKIARKKLGKYFAFVISGTILGFLVGFIFTKLTGNRIFGTAGIILGTLISRNLLNRKLKKNFTT